MSSDNEDRVGAPYSGVVVPFATHVAKSTPNSPPRPSLGILGGYYESIADSYCPCCDGLGEMNDKECPYCDGTGIDSEEVVDEEKEE